MKFFLIFLLLAVLAYTAAQIPARRNERVDGQPNVNSRDNNRRKEGVSGNNRKHEKSGNDKQRRRDDPAPFDQRPMQNPKPIDQQANYPKTDVLPALPLMPM